MIQDSSDFLHKGLRKFWESHGADTRDIPSDLIKRIRLVITHLRTAQNISDLADGLGKTRHFHQLVKYPDRYSMDVNGNYRITFRVNDKRTGAVSEIDLEDTH